jgi:hypothetical protein
VIKEIEPDIDIKGSTTYPEVILSGSVDIGMTVATVKLSNTFN